MSRVADFDGDLYVPPSSQKPAKLLIAKIIQSESPPSYDAQPCTYSIRILAAKKGPAFAHDCIVSLAVGIWQWVTTYETGITRFMAEGRVSESSEPQH